MKMKSGHIFFLGMLLILCGNKVFAQNTSLEFQILQETYNKTYINPLYGKRRPQIDFPNIIDLYESGQIRLEEMITRTYSLNELNEAFNDLLAGRNAKGVIQFE